MLIGCAHRQHDLCTVQRRKDIGFIFLTDLILQTDPGEEDPVAFFCQGIVNILRQHRVQRPVTVFIGLLIADENIIGCFLGGHRHNLPADLVDLFCLLQIYPPGHRIPIEHHLGKVSVIQNTVIRRTVAGGNLFTGGGIVHVLDAVLAQHQPPVGFRFLREVGNNRFINARRFIKFAGTAQPVGPGKQIQFLLVISRRHRLPAAAVFAFRNELALGKRQVTATHFAFDDCHGRHSPRQFLFSLHRRLRSARMAEALRQSCWTAAVSPSMTADCSTSTMAARSRSISARASALTGSE